MKLKTMIFSSMLFALLATPCLADPTSSTSVEAERVGQASANFYKSLNEMFVGDVASMFNVWSHADDVTYMGPVGDFKIGWEQVRAEWEKQASLKLGGEVLPVDVHVTVGDDLAVVQCREVGNNLDAEGRPLQVSIRATNVFRKEQGEWKMIGHHVDIIPFLDARPATPETK